MEEAQGRRGSLRSGTCWYRCESALPELPKATEALESSRAMDVDPTFVSGTPTNGDDDDINLDVDNLLDDDELDIYGDLE